MAQWRALRRVAEGCTDTHRGHRSGNEGRPTWRRSLARCTGVTLVLLLLACCVTSCGQSDDWQYPIRLGEPRSDVEGLLGSETPGMGLIRWYPASGFSVKYDSAGTVQQLNFKGNYGYDDWITTTHEIFKGVTVDLSLPELIHRLGEPAAVGTSEEKYGWHTIVWERPGHLIEVDVWVRDYQERGRSYPKDSVKWFTVTRTSGAIAAAEEGMSAERSVDLMSRSLKQRGSAWKCIPDTRDVCTPEGCKSAEPSVFVVIDFDKNQYARCDNRGCDSYPMTESNAGMFSTVSLPENPGMFLKVENDGAHYTEVVSLHFDVMISRGTCQATTQ